MFASSPAKVIEPDETKMLCFCSSNYVRTSSTIVIIYVATIIMLSLLMNVRLEFRHTLLFILSGWDFPIEPKWMNKRGKEVEKLNFSVVSRWYEEVLLSPSSWLMRIKYLMQMQNCRLGSSDDVSKYQHCACLENLNRIVYIFQRHAKKDSSWRHKRGIFDEIITAHESLARVVSKSFQAT